MIIPIQSNDTGALNAAISRIASQHGYDLSSLTTAIWEAIVRTGELPFDLANIEEPNDETLRAIKEEEAIWASGGPKGRFILSTK